MRITGLVCGGVAIVACWCGVPRVEARPRNRMICEEWRDYYYNAATGEFLEWKGEPYWTCYFEDEPVSQPAGPAPDLYGGGVATPRDPKRESCDQCEDAYEQCMNGVSRGIERCLKHYRRQTRDWCVRSQRKKFGRPLEGGYTCEPIEEPGGKPRMHCFGPAIDDCVESFAQDQPSMSVENTDKINVGFDWWGVGNDQTSTVTWGGSRGFIEGCRRASREAGSVCLERFGGCEEAAGGCR